MNKKNWPCLFDAEQCVKTCDSAVFSVKLGVMVMCVRCVTVYNTSTVSQVKEKEFPERQKIS